MSQHGKSGEQSMEEILASIRSSVDTDEGALVAQDSTAAKSNGGARPPAARAPAPNSPASNGNGRLQDALSQVVVGSAPLGASKGVGPSSPPPSAPPQPERAARQTAPSAANGDLKRSANAGVADDDLSDLFADPVPPVAANVPPLSAKKPTGATPLGTLTPAGDANAPSLRPATPTSVAAPAAPELSPSAPASSSFATPDVTATAKPSFSGLGPRQPEVAGGRVPNPMSEGGSKSEVFASMTAPTPSPPQSEPAPPQSEPAPPQSEPVPAQSEPVPSQQNSDPKPKREPSFAALRTLATGSPEAADPTPVPAEMEASKAPSVLLPEMQDLPDANPVAQMQSMAAVTSQSNTGGFVPTAKQPKMPDVISLPDDDPAEAPTEIVVAQKAAAPSTSESSIDDEGAGIAPGAKVAATPGSRSLEDIVVELLKPQLSQWLEANMPRIVERALRAEQQGSSDKKNS